MRYEWIFLSFAGFVCMIPVIVVFLLSPGGMLIRLAGSLATLVSFLLMGIVAWYPKFPPTEPLAAGLAILSLLMGWQLAKFLDRRINEKPAAGGKASPETGLRKIP